MFTREEAAKLIKKVLSFSAFPHCEVSVAASENAFIRFAVNGVTTSGYTVEQSMTITSTRDKRTGVASVDQFDDESLRKAVRQSEELAAIAPPNPESEEPLEQQEYPDVENYPPKTASARNDVMIPQIRAIVEAAARAKLVAAGLFERSAVSAAIGSNAGNFGFGRTADSRLSTTVRNPQGTSSGWASQPSVHIDRIDGAALAKIAIGKCLEWHKPERLEPGRFTVVLEPTAVSDLVERLGFSLNARDAEEGRSFLSKKGGGTLAGEKLFPETINLRTDPFHPLVSTLPWDAAFAGRGGGRGRRSGAAGMPTGRMAWIERGVVRNLYYDRYWARAAGKKPAPFPARLVLDGGGRSLADLIASVERGLLVTRFWYIRPVNPQTVQFTGLTRDGLFFIEEGKVARPVMNLRFNESPVRLLQNTIALGEPVRARGGEGSGMIAPALVVKDFPFTSVSDAV